VTHQAQMAETVLRWWMQWRHLQFFSSSKFTNKQKCHNIYHFYLQC